MHSEKDPTALGLLKRMLNVKFVGVLVFLDEILQPMNILSKIWQKVCLHFSAVEPTLQATIDRTEGFLPGMNLKTFLLKSRQS